MMTWGKGTDTQDVRDCKIVAAGILKTMDNMGFKMYNLGVYRVQLYKLIRKCMKEKIATPVEFMMALDERALYELIYHNQWAELIETIKNVKSGVYEDNQMAAVFYLNYMDTKSFFRAVIKTKHYPFANFDRKRLGKLFRTKKHLDHIVELFTTGQWSGNEITLKGIKEQYENKLLGQF